MCWCAVKKLLTHSLTLDLNLQAVSIGLCLALGLNFLRNAADSGKREPVGEWVQASLIVTV